MNEAAFFEPSVSHRFLTTFWFGNVPVPSIPDVSFQRIHGLSRQMRVTEYEEGGENLRNRFFVDKVRHGSLVLERGVMIATPLSVMFNTQLVTGKVTYFN